MPGADTTPLGSLSVLQSKAKELHEVKEDHGSEETCLKKTLFLQDMSFVTFNSKTSRGLSRYLFSSRCHSTLLQTALI